RFREGSWVFYRLSSANPASLLMRDFVSACGEADATIALDLQRLAMIKRQRAEAAAAYFRENAAQWDHIRSLYIDEREVEAALAEAARVLRPDGILIVVDFAPHTLEFLREEHAHRRLGFAEAEIADWCRAAALDPAPARHLPGDPLTVVIWTAWRREPAAPAPSRARHAGILAA